MTHKERKYINNLPRFDIGKMPTLSGYQLGLQVNLGSFSSTPGRDFNEEVKALNQANTLNLITLSANALNSQYNLVKYAFNPSMSSIGTNVGQGVQNGSLALSGGVTYGTEAAEVGSLVGDTTTTVGSINTVNTGSSAASGSSGAASAASATMGYVSGGIAAALGTYGIANDIIGYNKNRISSQDVINATGKQTASKYGLTYDLYGGTNTKSIMDYVDALNRGSKTSLALNSAGALSGIGSIVGTAIAPGIGTAIGAGAGFIVGGIGGLLGADWFGNKRKEDAERKINNALEGMRSANLQNEAEAGSLGLRNQFAATHSNNPTTGTLVADKGKIASFNNGKPMTFNSPSDLLNMHVGKLKPQGKASPDETWRNANAPLMERVGYFGSKSFNVNDKRQDNITLYGDIRPLEIAGHDEKAKVNNKFIATHTRPLGKEAEQIREEYKNTDNPIEKAHLENRMSLIDKQVAAWMNILLDLKERSDMKHQLNYKRFNADKGRNIPKFDPGLVNYAIPTGTHLAELGTLLSTPVNYSPVSYNAYQNNPYTSLMKPVYDDPTLAIKNVNNATRENIYSLNKRGDLSGGMRAYLNSNALLNGANTKNNIINQYNQSNNKYYMDWRDGMIKMGESQAARKQDATERYLNRQQEAYATAFNAKQARTMSLMNTLNSMSKDWMNVNLFNTSKDFQQRLIDMYGQKQTLDKQRFITDLYSNHPDRFKKDSKTYVPDVINNYGFYGNNI